MSGQGMVIYICYPSDLGDWDRRIESSDKTEQLRMILSQIFKIGQGM